MKRLVFAAIGGVFLLLPLRLLVAWMVPLPQYRIGTFADYDPVVRACVAVYGGAVVGLLAPLLARGAERPGRLAVWVRSFFGTLMGLMFAAIVAGRSDLLGLVLILGAGLSAMIAGGTTLMWHAIEVGSEAASNGAEERI